jgi:chorismate synthase
MSGNSFGKIFKISTWGESHGGGVGVVVEGCPAGLPLKESEIQQELDRRRTGQSKVTTTRKEADRIQIVSGAKLLEPRFPCGWKTRIPIPQNTN